VKSGVKTLSIGEAIRLFREEAGMSQREFAGKIAVDRSLIAKAENGLKLSETHDAAISRINWRLALEIIDERTGGYVSNVLHEIPNLDLHPSALKEILIRDLQEAEQALGELLLARHLDPEQRKKQAEGVWKEITDVINRGLVMRGVLEDLFQLDKDKLAEEHRRETKEGKR
jgi:transcriptional regulator with XRE-family HTH domain